MFEWTNVCAIGNVFMQYFCISLSVCWDTKKSWYHNFFWYIICLMCTHVSGILLDLETWKNEQNPFDWCYLNLHTTKSWPFARDSLASWTDMRKFHQNFQLSKIDDFYPKSHNLQGSQSSEILLYGVPRTPNGKDFVNTFMFVNP